VIEDVAGDDRADARRACLPCEGVDTRGVVGPPPLEQRHVAAAPVDGLEVGKRCRVRLVRVVWQQDRDHPLRPGRQVVPVQFARTFTRATLAERQQPRQARPGGAVGRVEEQAPPAGEIDARARDRAHAGRLLRLPGADDARHRAEVGDAERRMAEQGGGGEQLLRARRTAQQREVGEQLQLDIVGHANTPCIHQLRSPVSASTPSPRRNTQ